MEERAELDGETGALQEFCQRLALRRTGCRFKKPARIEAHIGQSKAKRTYGNMTPNPEVSRKAMRLVAEKRVRWLYLLAVFLFLLILVAPIYFGGEVEDWFFEARIAAVVGLSLCCVSLFVFVTLLIPGSSYLELTPEGFTFCCLYLRQKYRWENVSNFRAQGDVNCIVFDLTNGRSNRVYDRIYRAWSRHEFLADGYVLGKFKMTHQALIELLDEWRERYSGTKKSKSGDMA